MAKMKAGPSTTEVIGTGNDAKPALVWE